MGSRISVHMTDETLVTNERRDLTAIAFLETLRRLGLTDDEIAAELALARAEIAAARAAEQSST